MSEEFIGMKMEAHYVKALNSKARKFYSDITGNGESLKVAEQKVDTIRYTLQKDSFNSSEYNDQE